MTLSLSAAYRQRVASGAIAEDPAQARAVIALARVEGEHIALGEPSFSLPFLKKRPAPRGVYLYGPVGRGKSMLMDLFFASAPVVKKKRAHFHAFMAEVHGLIDQWRRGDAAARRAKFGLHKGDDPIAPAAGVIAEGARLLCFDEFHVTDIADAMILGRLFEALFALGVVVVATSNRAPDALYLNGINRQLFVPFIALIKDRLEVVEVAGPSDYRVDRLRGAEVYFSPLSPDAATGFDGLWNALRGDEAEVETRIEVMGRTLAFPRAFSGHARSSFAALCSSALGPGDYLAIAARFHTLFLENVPILTPDRRNEAARFVTLIDALYEARSKVSLLAAGEPGDLYPQGDGAFEFGRTISRLEEMRSAAWLEAVRD